MNDIREKFKRKRKWEIIKDKYMTVDLISLLLNGKTIDDALTYTHDEYSIPLMDWAG